MQTAMTPGIGLILLVIGTVLWKVDSSRRFPRLYAVIIFLGSLGMMTSPLTAQLHGPLDSFNAMTKQQYGVQIGSLAACVAVLVFVIHMLNREITGRTMAAAGATPLFIPFVGGSIGAGLVGFTVGIGNTIGPALQSCIG